LSRPHNLNTAPTISGEVQADLWRVSIPGIDDNAAICKECDTIWTHDEKIEDGSGINFRKFMS
ncbi:hypothetical protein, partial [uncultured Gimesia sp.]|uniref:hypothetical protein n=1 Tax=uncultured Gimesia sp. TaxID=1678688 RepID=UPI0026386C01